MSIFHVMSGDGDRPLMTLGGFAIALAKESAKGLVALGCETVRQEASRTVSRVSRGLRRSEG